MAFKTNIDAITFPPIARRLYKKIVKFANLKADGLVYDLIISFEDILKLSGYSERAAKSSLEAMVFSKRLRQVEEGQFCLVDLDSI